MSVETSSTATRIALFGAAPDTPNMGMSALFASAISGISRHLPGAEFVVFDNGLGRRDEILRTAAGNDHKLIRYGARGGRRYYRPENLAAISLASRMGPLGALSSKAIRLIDSCDAVLDVSGGDSFSDIYGRERFDNIYRPKSIAVNRSKPLILLPQTYGPYKHSTVRQLAASVVSKADMAWGRDPDSYAALKALLGQGFDPERHLCGVDMAFGLEPSVARQEVGERLTGWLDNKNPAVPLVGLNISGLIYNSPDGGAAAFGLKADYRHVVEAFLAKLLQSTAARVVLISHVMDQPGHYESDQAACIDVAKRLGAQFQDRIALSPASLDQSQVKWLISHMDWFCGTRMHSTIAALSSGVPSAAISYSDKTRGVFQTCNQEASVLDPRELDSATLVVRLSEAFEARETSRQSLRISLPAVMKTLEDQFKAITSRIAARRQTRRAA